MKLVRKFSIFIYIFRPLNFKLRYEFVDLGEDGAPIEGHNECNRQFISSLMDKRASNVFRSTRNVFSFGRGGQKDLKYA